jgi:hypothetical protein
MSRLGRSTPAIGGLGAPGAAGMGIVDPPRSKALRQAPPGPVAKTTEYEISVSLPAGSNY